VIALRKSPIPKNEGSPGSGALKGNAKKCGIATLATALAVAFLASGTFCVPPAQAAETPSYDVTVDGASDGRTFDGVGAVSGGGAVSRLLLDYPEQERNEVLDYLFKPNYGASLQILKVEIGGDTNSTDGSESSHEHVRGQVNCNAGYEWWMMNQAKQRNPSIKFSALAWGAPGWLGDGEYYSQDTIDYFIDWLGCATQHGFTIDNMGVRNERSYDSAWVKSFRKALDAAGYESVKIIASDEAAVKGEWLVAPDMAKDKELNDAISMLGNHYSWGDSSEVAKSLNKPLWISEGGPWSGEYGRGGANTSIPVSLNHSYIMGRITGYEIWNILTGYYDGLSLSDAGLMRANKPWSGTYDVRPAIWEVAQTTQFTQPGWQYLDASSNYLDPDDSTQGSYISLKSPDGKDFSTVIESMGTTTARTVNLKVKGGLPTGALHVWQTTPDSWFTHEADVTPDANGTYTVTVPANSTVTVTTTTGQGKGTATGNTASAFPFPFHSDLSEGGLSGQTPYFSQMEGAYEERACQGGRKGNCLTQVTEQPAIGWAAWDQPTGVIGDIDWQNYKVSVDAYVPAKGMAQVLGRVSNDPIRPVPNGYGLSLSADGTWSIGKGLPGGSEWQELAKGSLGADGTGWHKLALTFQDQQITAEVDGKQVGSVEDSTWISGWAGLSDNYTAVQFADLSVDPLQKMQTVAGDSKRFVQSGDTSSLVFNGTQIALTGKQNLQGTLTVSIDGSSPTTLTPDSTGSLTWRSPVLIDGGHTLEVKAAKSTSTPLDHVDIVPGTLSETSVDDWYTGTSEDKVVYNGDWKGCPGCSGKAQLFHGSMTTGTTPGSTAALTFNGSSAEIWGYITNKGGIADVSIDGKKVGQANFYSKSKLSNQLVWRSGNLPAGKHTLTLTVTDRKNAAVSDDDQAEINLDRIVVRGTALKETTGSKDGESEADPGEPAVVKGDTDTKDDADTTDKGDNTGAASATDADANGDADKSDRSDNDAATKADAKADADTKSGAKADIKAANASENKDDTASGPLAKTGFGSPVIVWIAGILIASVAIAAVCLMASKRAKRQH
jgi:hypothetical protein